MCANSVYFADKTLNENGRSNITIKGGSPDMDDARKYIEGLVTDNNYNGNGGSSGGGDRQRFQSQAHGSERNRDGGQSNASSNSRTIEIDQANVGLIIGRGGSKIRELEERFKVVLKIGNASLCEKSKLLSNEKEYLYLMVFL